MLAIVLGVWVYRDAEERGMEGVIWLLIVLLTGIIGLIIYLIVRE
ncbi:MAG: PLDc N-terminal domain-containing protein [Candidatus Jordarchaeum sp.]